MIDDGAAVVAVGANCESLFARICAGAAPRDRLSVSQWADRYRVLAGKAASEPGPWSTSRTPYLREPLDALSTDSEVEEVVLWFGTQLGKSEACNNWIGYSIDHSPGPVMLVQPTLDLAKRYSKQRIASMIESSPVLAEKVQPPRARDSGNTLLEKEFPGGILVIAGANSAVGLRSMPARDLLFDEIDAYPHSLDDEGDPISIAEKRQDTFASRRKRLKTSTCTNKGSSRIEQAYAASDQRKYFVPCPHCGHFQVLEWEGLTWSEAIDGAGAPTLLVHYVCGRGEPEGARGGCGAMIEEVCKTDMLARGEWRAAVPGARTRGYWLSSLYSPLGWLSWPRIVTEYLDAQAAQGTGDTTLLQVFTNTRLARTWEREGNSVAEASVQARAESYALRTVPRGVLLLTASVDVQGDRLELEILGWGRFEECWIIDYRKLHGDPAQPAVWSLLDDVLRTPLKNAFGLPLSISAAAIDHGGHHSAEVESFTRARAGRHVLAVKGVSSSHVRKPPIIGKPSDRDMDWKGRRVKRGAKVWPVGVDEVKHRLYSRLALDRAGPGYVHTSRDLDDDYYKGLTAERYVTRYVKGRPRGEWVLKQGQRNEPLDLWVYGYAAAAYLGMTRWKESDWDALAARVEPPLFDPERGAAVEVDSPEPEPAARMPAGRKVRMGARFVKRWGS